jgi:hypothetical protein
MSFGCNSGVFLKWIEPEHVYFTFEGKLVLGSLSGAVLASWGERASLPDEERRGAKQREEKKSREKQAALPEAEDIPKIIPRDYLHLVAPELILGAPASPQSSVFCAGSIAFLMLAGKPLIKVSALDPIHL